MLALCCRLLAAVLEREAEQRQFQQLRGQADESQVLADLGVLAGPLTHEFNNFLNIVLLQVAIQEVEAPQQNRDELSRLRQHGKSVSGIIQEWHRYRSRQPIPLQPLDLNQAIRQMVAHWEPRSAAKIQLALTDTVLRVTATPGDLQLLLRFLIGNAVAAASAVSVSTSVQQGCLFSASRTMDQASNPTG